MKKQLIIAFAVLAAFGAGIFYVLTTGNVGAKYNTVEVERGEVGQFVQDTGTISSRNIRRYYGSGAGKIEKMSLQLGDHVKKGQLLVKYEDKLDIEVQKVEKQIDALEAAYNEALSGTDMASVNSARIEISSIRDSLNMAKKNKERTEALYTSGGVSLTAYEQAVSSVEQLQDRLGIAQNAYNRLTEDISENIKAKYEAELDILLLTLDALKDKKDDYEIYSDIEGIVTEVNTFEGDMPSMGMVLIEVQDPTEKVVLVDFMAEDAMEIKPDAQATVEDMELNLTIDELKVDQVYPKAFVTLSELGVRENRQTVEIGLPQLDGNLPFGLEVETKVMIEKPRSALLVPVGAVIEKDAKQYVKVLEDGDLVEREIIVGLEMDGSVEVIDGLKEGEQVLLNYEED